MAVLHAVQSSSIVQLPTRLGLTIRPSIQSVVLVSKGARTTRPKTKIDGIDQVIKADQLRDLIERRIGEESAASALLSMGKIISPETLEDLARQIARLHRPITFDWAAKLGIEGEGTSQAEAAEPSVNAAAQRPVERASKPAADLKPPLPDTAPTPEGDLHRGRLSTSKLAAKLGIKGNAAMLDRLTSAGYLVRQGDQHVLTDLAMASGAVRIGKSRYGPYFLWPESIKL